MTSCLTVKDGPRARLPLRAALCMALFVTAVCKNVYRIGERVLVEYDGQQCPAYVVEKRGPTRLRVHFEFGGYPWEDDVATDRVLGRASDNTPGCELPDRVRLTLGLRPAGSKQQQRTGPYRVGENVRVRWRKAVYPATVLKVVAADQVRVHYHGHESFWDETVSVERIVVDR